MVIEVTRTRSGISPGGGSIKHSTASIFVCPERTFEIENGVIAEQSCPVDFWIDGKCSCCGEDLVGDKGVIENCIFSILEEIGENPDRPGLKDTPKRVARMYKEIFKGYDPEQKPILTAFKNEDDGISYDEMIMDSGFFHSYCEHHMALFSGQYFCAFIPNKKIIGLSKIARVVDYYSSKLQIQERLVTEIANELEKAIQPLGLGVMLRAFHSCKEARGIKNKGAMITSDLRGNFREQKVKEEFLTLIKMDSDFR